MTEAAVDTHRFYFDADCGICTKLALVVQRYARQPLELVPMHTAVPATVGVSEERYWVSAHFVTAAGREFHDGASVTRVLRLVPGGWLFAVLDVPGVSRLRDAGYYLVARNRHRISRFLGLAECRI